MNVLPSLISASPSVSQGSNHGILLDIRVRPQQAGLGLSGQTAAQAGGQTASTALHAASPGFHLSKEPTRVIHTPGIPAHTDTARLGGQPQLLRKFQASLG